MRLLRLILLVLCFTIPTIAQDKLKTPDSEVQDAIKFLVGNDPNGNPYVNKIDQQFIELFSTYAIPDEKAKQDAVLACSYILHSLVGPSKNFEENNAGGFNPLAKMVLNEETKKLEFVALQRVPFSNTLWWIDIRDFNFTRQAFETAAGLDGYFTVPGVQEPNNGALRLIAGNCILRMDSFMLAVTDTTRQRDISNKFDLYNTFLFAQVTPPKNISEWKKLFAIDTDKAREIGNEYGAIVTVSKAVALHNRFLFGYNTENSYLYETYDVKNQQGLRDYFEGFFLNKRPGTPPAVSDAGEVIGTNQLGLQVYALRNEKGELINFADPSVARNLSDAHGDVRVRVAHGCIDCHSSGIIPAENTSKSFVKENGDILLPNRIDRNRVKRVLLDGRFEDSVTFNRMLYARAIEKTNGLSPEDTGKAYMNTVENYLKSVDLKRAAFECGVSQELFKEKVSAQAFGGRLKLLINNNIPIPVDVWESRGADGIPGGFQQAMMAIHGVTKVVDTVEVLNEVPPDLKIVSDPKQIKIGDFIVLKEAVDLYSSSVKRGTLPIGTKAQITNEQNGFYMLEANGITGYAKKENIKF